MGIYFGSRTGLAVGYKEKEHIKNDPRILVCAIVWVVMLFARMGVTEGGIGWMGGNGGNHELCFDSTQFKMCIIRQLNGHCM